MSFFFTGTTAQRAYHTRLNQCKDNTIHKHYKTNSSFYYSPIAILLKFAYATPNAKNVLKSIKINIF